MSDESVCSVCSRLIGYGNGNSYGDGDGNGNGYGDGYGNGYGNGGTVTGHLRRRRA